MKLRFLGRFSDNTYRFSDQYFNSSIENSTFLELHCQGGNIEVYDVSPFQGPNSPIKQIQSLFVLEQSVIHKLKVFTADEYQYVLAFGGKQLCLVNRHVKSGDTGNGDFKIVYQQVFNDWILDVIILTSRNEEHFSLAIAFAHNLVILYNWMESCLIKEVHCMDKCILYSAHFIAHNKLWDELLMCSGTVFNQIIIWKPCSNEILKRFCGHDGVIFDMSFSYEFEVLFSASDDRSIRVWNCNFISSKDHFHESSDCLCTMYGHEARIWRVESNVKDGEMCIVSVAEDGLCIVWNLKKNTKNLLTSSLTKKMNFRANMLSLSLVDNDMFATGSCDGSIRLLNLKKVLHSQKSIETSSIDKECHGTVKTVMLLRRNGIVVIVHTDKGALLLYNIKQKYWKVLATDSLYGSYAVVRINHTEEFIAFGNTKGFLKVRHLRSDHSLGSSVQLQPFASKVLNLSWSENNIFVSGPDGCLSWYLVHGDESSVKLQLIFSFALPQAKHRWATAVALLSNNLLVCGDRRGSIHMYGKEQPDPLQTFHGVHGKLGVTSLRVQESSLISTGRDGHWRLWTVAGNKLHDKSKHRAVQGMDWLEGCDVISNDQKLYVYGFHGNKFVVWSRYSGDEIFSLLCGGGHRSWDFSLSDSCFVFLKAGKLNIAQSSFSISDECLVSTSLHSQHINCVRHLWKSHQENDETVHVLATSGEDTKVIISLIVTNNNKKQWLQMRTLHTLDDHLSNVRCLASLVIFDCEMKSKILLVTGGGRAMLHVYVIKILKNTTVTKISVTAKHLISYQCQSQESETRFMSIALWKAESSDCKMAVACSDGRIRMFKLHNFNELIPTDESKEYSNCFLCVSYVDDYLFCGSTNGRMFVMTSFAEELTSFPCHQSGVNSMGSVDVSLKDNKHVLLATGGDDNSIHLMLLVHAENNFSMVSSLKITNSHSAQITGIRLQKLDKSRFNMSSVSIDQRLIRWEVLVEKDLKICCKEKNCIFTFVADIACMDECEDDYFVCGQGISHHVYNESQKSK